MYRKTVAEIDGKRATIGNNGDIVEVVRKTAAGLVLRNARGQTAEIDWKRLSDPKTGRLLLGFGHAFTIDAAQGMSTKGEHINALPHGTAATSAFKTYTAESRATGRTHTLISKAAVHAAVQRSRALGDVTPMTEDDLWKEVAKNASERPYKALALDTFFDPGALGPPIVRRQLRQQRHGGGASTATPYFLTAAATSSAVLRPCRARTSRVATAM
jgi:hypothetical protein